MIWRIKNVYITIYYLSLIHIFIVAINKMDKHGANPDRIKQQLTEYDQMCIRDRPKAAAENLTSPYAQRDEMTAREEFITSWGL